MDTLLAEASVAAQAEQQALYLGQVSFRTSAAMPSAQLPTVRRQTPQQLS